MQQSVVTPEPWIVLGDFICILDEDERFGGRDVTYYQLIYQLDCLSQAGLMDLSFTGPRYTWELRGVKSKLDRIMVNGVFLETFPNASAHFHPSGYVSDHSPRTLTIHPYLQPKANLFRYFNMWSFSRDFLPLLKPGIRTLVEHMFKLSSRVDMAIKELEDLQLNPHYPRTSADWEHKIRYQKKITKRLMECERRYFAQLAKNNYTLHSDRNSAFFHSILKRNKAEPLFRQYRNLMVPLQIPLTRLVNNLLSTISNSWAPRRRLFHLLKQ